jgi:hypothetical protein
MYILIIKTGIKNNSDKCKDNTSRNADAMQIMMKKFLAL